jgi:hypothetical protein
MLPVNEWLFAALKEEFKQGTSTIQLVNWKFADHLHAPDKGDLKVGTELMGLMTRKIPLAKYRRILANSRKGYYTLNNVVEISRRFP